MTDLNAQDIAELRRQGDFEAFLAQITGRRVQPEQPAPESEEPGYQITRPGAWPISGPLPRPTFAAAEVDRAVAEYRAWELHGRPACDTTCECPNCTPEEAS